MKNNLEKIASETWIQSGYDRRLIAQLDHQFAEDLELMRRAWQRDANYNSLEIQFGRVRRKPSAKFFDSSIDLQKIAPQERTMKGKLPVLMNRAQLSEEINFPLRKLYRAKIEPDALDAKGAPLFRAERLDSIAQLLRKPEVLA